MLSIERMPVTEELPGDEATVVPDYLLTRRETARCLRVHPRTVDRLVAANRLRAVRVGRRVLIAMSEVHRFIAGKE